MSERKVLNKYYPPDFDPAKIPRMKLAKNRQYTVRLMAPFNMRCVTCGEYIYKGKKFNARKEDVEDQTYLGIRIYRFYIKCTRCLQEISFKTDPQNTDYEIEAGATRNFMALKLAEEQAKKEEDELKEEEANNPMKLLENRTQQSRNEIELLESLEELKDLNRRQQSVDYDTMLQQYNTMETEREREERLQKQDEDFIKSVNFSKSGTKRIATEEIIEFDEDGSEDKKHKNTLKQMKFGSVPPSTTVVVTATTTVPAKGTGELSVGSFSQKNMLKNLVKKSAPTANISSTVNTVTLGSINDSSAANPVTTIDAKKTINALSMLSSYSDSDSDNNSN